MPLCKLTHEQYRQWQESGNRPDCIFHHHVSTNKALQMVLNDEALWLTNMRAIIVYTCVEAYVLQGKSSAGYRVMQLAPIHTSP